MGYEIKDETQASKVGNVIYVPAEEMQEWLNNGFNLGSFVKFGGQVLKVISYCPHSTLGDKTQRWKFGFSE